MSTADQSAHERSPLAVALSAVGDRWTLLVVEALLDGPLRFNELQERIDGIAPNILSNRIRRLEQHNLVVGQPYSDRPRRFVYELTAAGRELAGALRLLADWGARHSGAERTVHAACGTPLEARWYCPTCDHAVDEPGDEGVHYA
jgi:DNA-binding HxlR family transcriptional regulator